ncbi:hypothetical protein CFC21_036929 [Triticum aestivum]|uniref:PRA1 family protein n=2 Tax=Triticum aestivum TaxID=4565 RepID=A0A3B6EKX6_WHEAT|nr:hypothetical protein CFC21_036929 [Triticum aestivum]
MDGRPATADDVVEAMREFVWFPPPRPASEFFSRFSAPRSCSKWISRLECNLYYYGTNYFILILLIGMSFLQKPVAILTAFATGLSIAFFSDSFAVTSTNKVISIVRKFSPDLAAQMRPYINDYLIAWFYYYSFTRFLGELCLDCCQWHFSSVRHGRPSMKGSTHICGRPLSMWVFALFLFEVSCIFWASSCNFLIVPWELYVGLLVTLIHASFRERNLKGRLNRFRKEFREAW